MRDDLPLEGLKAICKCAGNNMLLTLSRVCSELHTAAMASLFANVKHHFYAESSAMTLLSWQRWTTRLSSVNLAKRCDSGPLVRTISINSSLWRLDDGARALAGAADSFLTTALVRTEALTQFRWDIEEDPSEQVFRLVSGMPKLNDLHIRHATKLPWKILGLPSAIRFNMLKRLAILDIGSLRYLPLVASYIGWSVLTLKSLKISLSDKLAMRSFKQNEAGATTPDSEIWWCQSLRDPSCSQLPITAPKDPVSLRELAIKAEALCYVFDRLLSTLSLDSLSIGNFPLIPRLIFQVVDVRKLKHISLLNVGSQYSFWRELLRRHRAHPLPLTSIHTDHVTPPFLKFLHSLENVTELFMFNRCEKFNMFPLAPGAKVSIENLTSHAVRKHCKHLRRLVMRNDMDDGWSLDYMATNCLKTLGGNLVELAVGIYPHILPTFMKALGRLTSLEFLQILLYGGWKLQDAYARIMEELAKQSDVRIEYLAICDMSSWPLSNRAIPVKSRLEEIHRYSGLQSCHTEKARKKMLSTWPHADLIAHVDWLHQNTCRLDEKLRRCERLRDQAREKWHRLNMRLSLEENSDDSDTDSEEPELFSATSVDSRESWTRWEYVTRMERETRTSLCPLDIEGVGMWKKDTWSMVL